MKIFFILCSLLMLSFSAQAQMPASIDQGQPAIINFVSPSSSAQLIVIFQERIFYLDKAKNGIYWGLIATDLKTDIGNYPIIIKDVDSELFVGVIQVKGKDYGVREITVQDKYVNPQEETLARIRIEAEEQTNIYATVEPVRYWQAAFDKPLDSKIVGFYGRKSIINGHPKSPHGGVDFRGATGTPIKAVGDGKVVYVKDTYFSGNTILIDHGQGLVSGYRHLSQFKVALGQWIKKGDIIGLVGATGRVTGPHLHFDIRLSGATVDPLAVMGLTKEFLQKLQQ